MQWFVLLHVVYSRCFAATSLWWMLRHHRVWPFAPLRGRCFATESVLARFVGGCFAAIRCLDVWPHCGRCFATETMLSWFIGWCFAIMVTWFVSLLLLGS
jgi:hypothetical protein